MESQPRPSDAEPPLVSSLRGLSLKSEYDTEEDSIIRDLYRPCLARSISYDRAVGYFRANVYRELGEDLLDFAVRGGKVRIVCSPDLPEPDEMAARRGYELRGSRNGNALGLSLEATIRAMETNPDEADCLAMLQVLIERGSLDLFVAVRPGGIYHRKIGRFRDRTGEFVVFSGSGNETRPALGSLEDWTNDEEFDVFCSWGAEFERRKASRKGAYLDRLFAGGTTHTRVRPLSAVEHALLDHFRRYESLEAAREGARRRAPRGATERSTEDTGVQPYFFQRQAVNAWERNHGIGLVSMATGTGKTLTALFAINGSLKSGNPVLIVVPSKLLIEQWKNEFRRIYPDVPLLVAGGGYDWRSDPSKRMYIAPLARPRAILATMQTAASDDFLEFIGQAHGLVLVADEVHRLGSERNRRLLEIDFARRLGLSATPERLFDPIGTEALVNSFGAKPVYELQIGDKVKLAADDPKETPILGRFLSRYRYDFETVDLTAAEQEAWNKITVELKRRLARHSGKDHSAIFSDPRVQYLLIERSRIVKKAAGKVELAEKVITSRYPSGGRWIVYCQDEDQLDMVVERLRKRKPDVAVLKYHSMMSGQERTDALEYFEKNPSIIASIRCLDEGVDIPAADGGLILASSTNPREYIQRRGRLLRKALGKGTAEIIDSLVLPAIVSSEADVPVSIVRSEIARGYNFAQNAVNPEVTHRLWQVCQEFGVDPKNDGEVGFEIEAMGDET